MPRPASSRPPSNPSRSWTSRLPAAPPHRVAVARLGRPDLARPARPGRAPRRLDRRRPVDRRRHRLRLPLPVHRQRRPPDHPGHRLQRPLPTPPGRRARPPPRSRLRRPAAGRRQHRLRLGADASSTPLCSTRPSATASASRRRSSSIRRPTTPTRPSARGSPPRCWPGSRRYRDHPALRMWAIGNEVLHKLVYPSWMPIRSDPAWEQRARDFAAFYVELIDRVRAADPNHPIVHRDAEDAYLTWLRDALQAGGRRPWFIYGVNAYTPRLAEILTSWPGQGWDVPLLVSEFAPGGMSPADRPEGFRSMWKMIRGANGWVLGGAVYAWTTDGPEEVDRVFGLVDADGSPVDGAFAAVGSFYRGVARQADAEPTPARPGQRRARLVVRAPGDRRHPGRQQRPAATGHGRDLDHGRRQRDLADAILRGRDRRPARPRPAPRRLGPRRRGRRRVVGDLAAPVDAAPQADLRRPGAPGRRARASATSTTGRADGRPTSPNRRTAFPPVGLLPPSLATRRGRGTGTPPPAPQGRRGPRTRRTPRPGRDRRRRPARLRRATRASRCRSRCRTQAPAGPPARPRRSRRSRRPAAPTATWWTAAPRRSAAWATTRPRPAPPRTPGARAWSAISA